MRHSKLAIRWTKAVTIASLFAFTVGCDNPRPKSAAAPDLSPQVESLATITTFFTGINPRQSINNSPTITFEFASNFADARFLCVFNDDDPMFCTSPKNFSNLPDGNYKFRVLAQSPTGGNDPIGVTHFWRVDTVPPVTSLVATPTANNAILFALSANEPNCTFVCSVNHGALIPCNSPVSVSGLPAGIHNFRAFAIDEATNMDPNGAEYNFEFSNMPAITTTITNTNPTTTYTKQNNMRIEFISNHTAATFECRLNGLPPVSCTNPEIYSQLSDGNYVFNVRAIDAFGVKDPVGANHSWTVDTTPALGSNVRAEASSTSLSISWTTNEPATSQIFWGKDPNVNRQILDDGVLKTQHRVRLTGLSSNTVYIVEPAGQDRAGNVHRMPRLSTKTLR